MSKLKHNILELYRRLAEAPSLQPGELVNSAFAELVTLSSNSTHAEAQKLLSDPEIQAIIPELRRICAVGEGELESYWAKQITASDHPTIQLESFPYYDNYLKLTELEYRSMGLIGAREIKRVLFVGSGPLPLSSVVLARQYGVYVDNIDNDAQAVTTSTALINHLGLGDIIHTELGDATEFEGYGDYDAVFLASLVGLESPQKQAIINRIQKQLRPGSLLVVRTAHDLRTLLYPAVDIDTIAGLKPQVVIQPLNEVVNSIIILEKPFEAAGHDLVVIDKSNEATASLFREFATTMIANVYHYPYNPSWHSDLDRADAIYGRPQSNMFVVRQNDEVLGVAAIRPYDRDYAMFAGRYDETTGSIWRFFIKPQYRGLGIDALLQKNVESFAKQAGYRTLYAHDQRDVAGAVQKYIRNGYEVTYESNDRLGTVHFEKKLAK